MPLPLRSVHPSVSCEVPWPHPSLLHKPCNVFSSGQNVYEAAIPETAWYVPPKPPTASWEGPSGNLLRITMDCQKSLDRSLLHHNQSLLPFATHHQPRRHPHYQR